MIFFRNWDRATFDPLPKLTTNRGEWRLANRHELSHFILDLAMETSKKVKEKYV